MLFQGDQGVPGPPGPKVIQDSAPECGGKLVSAAGVAQLSVLLCRVNVALWVSKGHQGLQVHQGGEDHQVPQGPLAHPDLQQLNSLWR